jgi:hypothetical protein
VVAEIGVGGPGCQHQVVVGKLFTAGQRNLPRLNVDAYRLVISTWVFCWCRRIVRMGRSMSAGDSTASATW